MIIFTLRPLSFSTLYLFNIGLVSVRRFYGALQVLNVHQKKAYVFCAAMTRRRRRTRFHSRVSFAFFCSMQGMQFRARECNHEEVYPPISMPSTWAMWKAPNLLDCEQSLIFLCKVTAREKQAREHEAAIRYKRGHNVVVCNRAGWDPGGGYSLREAI